MQKNIILAGVGGQGILSMAFCICNAALKKGLDFKQSEVHGMSQRGGAVESHVRFSSDPIRSDIIPRGKADVVLSIEPLEVLRYVHFLSPEGVLVVSTVPYENIPNYPPTEFLLDKISVFRRHVLIDSGRLAKLAGSPHCGNMVMLGAAASDIEMEVSAFDKFVTMLFGKKSQRVVDTNLKALRLGVVVAELFRKHAEEGMETRKVLQAIEEVSDDSLLEQAEKLLPAGQDA